MTEHIALGEYAAPQGTDPLFHLARPDRHHHVYVIGRTGLGKTTLLRNMLLQDIDHGEGVMLLDPHGDLASELLDQIPRHRAGDVIYFDPADLEHPAGLNLLRSRGKDEHHLIVSGVMTAMRHTFGIDPVTTPRLEELLSNAIAAVLGHGNGTLLGVHRMLSDEDFREKIVDRVSDPFLAEFWNQRFAGWDKRYRTEATTAVLNLEGRAGRGNVVGDADRGRARRRAAGDRERHRPYPWL